MYVSRTLIFVICGLILIIIVIFILDYNQRSSTRINTPLSNTTGLQLSVAGYATSRLQIEPVINTWHIASELWLEPQYYSNNVLFDEGILNFNTTGIYQVTINLVIQFHNDSYNDIPVDVWIRTIRRCVRRQIDESTLDPVDTVLKNDMILARDSYILILTCSNVVVIDKEDLMDGCHSVGIEYMIGVNESDPVVNLSKSRLSFNRNDSSMVSRVVVVKLN